MEFLQVFDRLVVVCHLLTPPCSLTPPPAHSHSLSLTHPCSICLRANTHPHGVWARICASWRGLEVTQHVHPRGLPVSICHTSVMRVEAATAASSPEARRPLHIQFFLRATSVSLFTCFQPQLKQKPNVRLRERRNPVKSGWTNTWAPCLTGLPPCMLLLQPSQALSAPYAQRLFCASVVLTLQPHWL